MGAGLEPTRPDLDCLTCTKEWKCCAFQPFVPNFLLGGFLAEGGDLYVQREMLQPLGLVPTRAYRDRFEQTPESERGIEFLCTFYRQDTGRCGNWQHRPGECSTYFCRPDGFDVGKYSSETFNIETAIAQMALSRLGFEGKRIAQQIDHLNDPEPHPARFEFSYLMEIYRRSWDWALVLRPEQVRAWTGQLQWT